MKHYIKTNQRAAIEAKEAILLNLIQYVGVTKVH